MMNRDGRVGPYTILGPLNPSPKPRVHVARRDSPRDLNSGLFALEIVDDASDADWMRQRLVHQAQVAAPLDDRRVIPTRDVLEQNGEVFVVSDLIQGDSLRHLLQAGAKLQKMHAAALARELTSILIRMRAFGIVHGDLCPSTIMITTEGRVLVREVGLARAISRTNEPIGHFAYMSPERAHARVESDHRTDLYSLGIILWELLTGERALTAPNAQALRRAAMKPEIAKPTSLVKCGRELEEIILRALAVDRDDRYPDAESLHRDLDRYVVSRAPGTALFAELAQLMPKYLGAKLRGQKSLVERWASRTARPISSISKPTVPNRPAIDSPEVAAQLFAEIDLAVQDLSGDIVDPSEPLARSTSKPRTTIPPPIDMQTTDDIVATNTGDLAAKARKRRFRAVDIFFVCLLLTALGFALSTYILTGAGDEVLEFWRTAVFQGTSAKQ